MTYIEILVPNERNLELRRNVSPAVVGRACANLRVFAIAR